MLCFKMLILGHVSLIKKLLVKYQQNTRNQTKNSTIIFALYRHEVFFGEYLQRKKDCKVVLSGLCVDAHTPFVI
jgi:hypothetical protein